MRYFDIGKIVNTQGIRGLVRVVPFTDEPSRFELLDCVTAVNKKVSLELKIESVSYHKQFVIMKFYGIDDMTTAEKLKESTLKIPKEKALPLGENEYYIGDLIGINVITDEGENLGKITDIIFTGANDVYVVSDDKKNELLIPAIKQCIISVDIQACEMRVKLLEGLR